VTLFVPAECRLRLRAGQAHFAAVARAAHRGGIESQLPKPLREFIQADPIDRGARLIPHGGERTGRKELRGAWHVSADERQELERVR